MKKYTTPELNVTRFDVEDVITASTGNVYVKDENGIADAKAVNFDDIFA
jgi:hypothetical protein